MVYHFAVCINIHIIWHALLEAVVTDRFSSGVHRQAQLHNLQLHRICTRSSQKRPLGVPGSCAVTTVVLTLLRYLLLSSFYPVLVKYAASPAINYFPQSSVCALHKFGLLLSVHHFDHPALQYLSAPPRISQTFVTQPPPATSYLPVWSLTLTSVLVYSSFSINLEVQSQKSHPFYQSSIHTRATLQKFRAVFVYHRDSCYKQTSIRRFVSK